MTIANYLGGCDAFADRTRAVFGCCDSCHDDANEGWGDLLEVEMADGYYRVCCAAFSVYKDAAKEGAKP